MSHLTKLSISIVYTLYVLAIVVVWIWFPLSIGMDAAGTSLYFFFGWILVAVLAGLPAMIYAALSDY